jgi:hypothetical protein
VSDISVKPNAVKPPHVDSRTFKEQNGDEQKSA